MTQTLSYGVREVPIVNGDFNGRKQKKQIKSTLKAIVKLETPQVSGEDSPLELAEKQEYTLDLQDLNLEIDESEKQGNVVSQLRFYVELAKNRINEKKFDNADVYFQIIKTKLNGD